MFALFDDISVKCGYVGPQNRLHSRIKDVLSMNEVELGHGITFADFAALGRKESLSYDYLFVDLDGMGGILEVIDRLAALRLEYPSVPVILISADFEVDDFGTTRRALCDVSLRNPVLFASLEIALFEALENNRAWRSSVASYRQDTAA